MRAGALDQRLRIESRVDTVNSVGQAIPTWSVFASTIPAERNAIRGQEYFAAQQLTVQKAMMFRIRYLPGLNASMRIWFENEVWDIAAIVEGPGRHREMLVYCATGLTEG